MAASLFIYNFEHVQRINLCCCWKFSVIQPPTAVPLRRDYVRIVILKNTTKSTRRHLHRISFLIKLHASEKGNLKAATGGVL